MTYSSRHPTGFGHVEAAVVQRGHGDKAAERLRPFSALGARSIAMAAASDQVERAGQASQHLVSASTKQKQQQLLQRRPYELLPWNSEVVRNPFAKDAVTKHLPHIAKSAVIRRVPLAHLGLQLEIDDTVGLPHHGSWALRNEQRAASLGQVLMKSMARMSEREEDAEFGPAAQQRWNEEERRRQKQEKTTHAMASSVADLLQQRVLRGHQQHQHRQPQQPVPKHADNNSLGLDEVELKEEEDDENEDVERYQEQTEQQQHQQADELRERSSFFESPMRKEYTTNPLSSSLHPADDGETKNQQQHHHRDDDNDTEQHQTAYAAARRRSQVLSQSHFSLALATKRTRSVYLQKLASKLEEMDEEEEENETDDHHGQSPPGHASSSAQNQQQSLSAVFGEMARIREDFSVAHGGIEMPPDLARKRLMQLFEEDQARRDATVAALATGAKEQPQQPPQQRAADASAMDDAAPPSSGFESNHQQHPPLANIGPRRNVSAGEPASGGGCSSAVSSSRGFFLNGKQRHALVEQIVHRAHSSQRAGSSSPPHQQQEQRAKSKHNFINNAEKKRTISNGDDDEAAFNHVSNQFKYNPEMEVARAQARSWQFRDHLNLRHSTVTAAAPKVRRTITSESNPDPRTNMRDCLTGTKLAIL